MQRASYALKHKSTFKNMFGMLTLILSKYRSKRGAFVLRGTQTSN